jgi:hypothetical protein
MVGILFKYKVLQLGEGISVAKPKLDYFFHKNRFLEAR